jgi:hypothetical protein
MLPLALLVLLNLNGTLDVDIWVNKEGAVYQPGEKLQISFETTEDCYAAVYDIEPGGRASRLFPPEGDSGWVKAEHTYELPSPTADVDYVVGEDPGEEEFVVLASRDYLPTLADSSAAVVRKIARITIEAPEPARLRIISTPAHGRIYITEVASGDKIYAGRAPKTIELEPGDYVVTVTLAGYYTISRHIRLEAGEWRRIFVRLWE